MSHLVERHAKARVEEALADTRVVVIQGARQVGKSTLSHQVAAGRNARLVTLDDPSIRAQAAADPIEFVSQHPDGLLVIDEIQREPSLVLALKTVVDRDPRPGRFLVTGSADLLRLPSAQDSLAGRAESIELHGFSQGELVGRLEGFIDRLFEGDRFTGHTSDLTRRDYVERATAGSYPEALARAAGTRRSRWLTNYVSRIVERDAAEASRLHSVSELPRLLGLLAARNGEELNKATLASELEMPVRTLDARLDLLKTLYLTHDLPAWHANLGARLVKRPKVMLLDTGLAAALIHRDARAVSPQMDPSLAGHMIESFVAGEVRRQMTWCEQPVRLHHFRSHDRVEVDMLLETPDGRVAGIEVKATSAPGARDAKGLSYLRDRLGDRFVGGLVLNTGSVAGPLGPRINAAPIDVLWTT